MNEKNNFSYFNNIKVRELLQRKRLVRLVSYFVLPMLILGDVPEIINGVYSSIFLNLVFAGLVLLANYFNNKNYIELGSNLFLIGIILFVFFINIQFPVHSLNFTYFFPVIISIPFFVTKSNRYIFISFFIFASLLFTSVFFVDYSFLRLTNIHDIPEWNGPLNAFFSIVLVAFFSWYLLDESDKSDEIMLNYHHKINADRLVLLNKNTELNNIVYSISHDLRAPIATALGLMEVSKKENDFEQLKHFLILIENSLKRTNRYIVSILEFLKNSRLSLSVEKVNLYDEIWHAIELNKPNHDDVQFNVLFEKDLTFFSDATRLKMIFNNLISNAVRYSKPDQMNTIRFHAEVIEKQVKLTISDEGIGIADKNLDKIFNMFYKADVNKRGNGLGLYIVKEAVHKLGGTIQVQSEVGLGTTFTIFLPKS
jgi:signal transduction histidine kinase